MFGDYDTELFDKYGRIAYYHLEPYLAKYKRLLKWKPNESIADLGCRTGVLTRDLIKPLVPRDFSRFVCTDISEKMLNDSQKKFIDVPKFSFEVVDIVGKLDEIWISAFDHIFSAFYLKWFLDQKTCFSNIYQMLSPGGACFLVFSKRNCFKDTMSEMLDRPKWKKFIPDDEIYIMPYQDDDNPVETITEMMTSIGFNNIHVNVEESDFKFKDDEEFLGFYRAFPSAMKRMSAEEQKIYLDEALKLAYVNNIIGESKKDEITGSFFVVYGEK